MKDKRTSTRFNYYFTVDLPQKKNRVVVQEYIDRPFLIRGLKFDLRIYVLMTSISPLRLYLYEDGLVRFATKEYSYNVEDIDNKFIHITNFSVNKNNKDFVYNENPGRSENTELVDILINVVEVNTRVTSGM